MSRSRASEKDHLILKLCKLTGLDPDNVAIRRLSIITLERIVDRIGS